MLPYTPLHHLLMAGVGRPILCTSGNLSEEPMAITTEDAVARLGPIADVLLTHDRPIVRPVDDSIVRVGLNGIQILRRARGYAPLPIGLRGVTSQCEPTVLALGGHLKNTVALALRRVRETHQGECEKGAPLVRSTHPTPDSTQVVMSAHVGDLDSVLSVDVFRRAADDLTGFFQVTPDAVACDLHPDYASTQYAERLAAQWDVSLLRVQHHHAHVAACMAEHGLQGPVLGFAWDGTGYGADGTVWGGEMLLCQEGEFRRVAHLRTFALPGGDRAVREPRRSALGLLFECLGPDAAEQAAAWFNAAEAGTLISMLSRGVNSPRTSSMGRLFDGVAAICGLPAVNSFEGQAAMALEFAADEQEQGAYQFVLSDNGGQPVHGSSLEWRDHLGHPDSHLGHPDRSEGSQAGEILRCAQNDTQLMGASPAHSDAQSAIVVDWLPVVRAVLEDRRAGVSLGRISARFHNGLADMAVEVARRVAGPSANSLPVVLSGGCFQNRLLTARVAARLSGAGFRVYTHQEVPPGDGGIALGQLFVALHQMRGSCDVSRNPR
jgi:hydrogenase maturation protein HypF